MSSFYLLDQQHKLLLHIASKWTKAHEAQCSPYMLLVIVVSLVSEGALLRWQSFMCMMHISRGIGNVSVIIQLHVAASTI